MVFGTIISVLAWGVLNRGYKGNRPIMMGFIGSSFYLLAFLTALSYGSFLVAEQGKNCFTGKLAHLDWGYQFHSVGYEFLCH